MKFVKFAALAAALAALAGCTVSGPVYNRPVVTPQPAGIDGNWLGTDGVAISTFAGGRFNSYAMDTGAQLATGNYSVSGGRDVSLTLVSLVRNTTTQVNCLAVSTQQMNCTTQTGAQFTLLRTNQRPPVAAVQSAAAPGGVAVN